MSNRLPGTYALTDLALFPIYADSEDYFKKTGKIAPMYDPRFEVKNWEDPDAASKRFVSYTVVEWDNVNVPTEGTLDLPGKWAASVNLLPPNYTALTEQEKKIALEGATPLPIRPLKSSEVFKVHPLGGVYVVDTAVAELPTVPAAGDGFTKADRELLGKIAAKLGV